MGTLVTIEVIADLRNLEPSDRADLIERPVERAFEWIRRVEECCTRFDPESELMKLSGRVGIAVPVSPILYEAVHFALLVAEESGGAFDPTVGQTMESLGFNREYSSGRAVGAGIDFAATSYRDVRLNHATRTITLLAPLILDLGAVAKGLAIDLAVRELSALKDFSVNAGGDLYLGGCNANGAPWSIGIRHPRRENELIGSVRVSNCAVCSSGDYERRIPESGEHHILDPRSRKPAPGSASATVIAPTAMAADALATAAFVLGPAGGIRFLDRCGVDGLIVSPDLEEYATQGMTRDYSLGAPAFL
jgi:thiamine biosynthesis lipoprotein